MMAGFVELGIEASTDSDVWDFFVDAPLDSPGEGSTSSALPAGAREAGSK
jgi:hypothetical protein